MPSKRTYSKPALSVPDQVNLMASRGLIIPDKSKAEQFLSFVNYYRFSAYTLYFEQPGPAGCRSHAFIPSTTFAEIKNLYDFDNRLRSICLEAIDKIEVAFKTAMCLHMALSHNDPHWYQNPRLFADVKEHTSFLASLDRDLTKKRRNETFISHYFNEYSSPQRPPAWAVAETLSLGTASRIYANLRIASDHKAVAGEFSIPAPILKSWMHSLTSLRNFCAHHSRVWNRKFPFEPAVPKSMGGTFRRGDQFYHFAQVIRQLLIPLDAHRSWLDSLRKLLKTRTDRDRRAMGFIQQWEKEPLWLP